MLIIANTVTLSLDRFPITMEEVSKLEFANLIFTVLFALEMILISTAYGIRQYVRDPLNIFDTVIVMISLVDSILSATDKSISGGGFAAITAFRTLRLFRILKLARNWMTLRTLLMTIAATLVDVGYFTVLLLLFMIIFALLGMEFFAYNVIFDGQSVRVNCDTFYNAMITVFILLTNENWNAIAYDYLRAFNNW